MELEKIVLVVAAVVAVLSPISCSKNEKAPPDAGAGDAGADAGADTDTWPDLAGLDCAFTLAAGPFVIRSTTAGHVAFPDVARRADGDLLLVYREASEHGVDPTGRIVRQIGAPDALAWSDPEVLHDTPGIDDRDPSVTVAADGGVLVNWFQYVYEATDDGDLGVHQIFLGAGDAAGAALDTVAMVPDEAMDYAGAHIGGDDLWLDAAGDPVIVTACSSPIREVGGSWFVQSYGGEAWNTGNPAAPRSRVSLFASGDGAAPWAELPIAAGQAEETWLQEPALLALGPNRWIVQLRTAEGASPGNRGDLWQTRTDDGGATWSEYEDLGFVGHAPYLYRLSNGVIVSAFRWLEWTGASPTATNVDFIYSLDEGATWSGLVAILEPQAVEVGYPSIIELDDDKMLIVFYVGGTTIRGAIYDFALVDAG